MVSACVKFYFPIRRCKVTTASSKSQAFNKTKFCFNDYFAFVKKFNFKTSVKTSIHKPILKVPGIIFC